MDSYIPARPKPKLIPIHTEAGPSSGMRSVGLQAQPEVLAAAPSVVEHRVVIEIRHVMPPPVAMPMAAAVAPPAPAPVEDATTWWGKAWQRAKPPLMWVGWAMLQILAVINVPLILNFGRRA